MKNYNVQRAAQVRAGTPNKTGSRSYSIAVPPALAHEIPAGTVFWATLAEDGSLVFRPIAVAQVPPPTRR